MASGCEPGRQPADQDGEFGVFHDARPDDIDEHRGMQSRSADGELQPPADRFLVEVNLVLARIADWPILRGMLEAGSRTGPSGAAAANCVAATYLPGEGRLILEFATPDSGAIRRALMATNLAPVRLLPAVALSTLTPITQGE
jgi:hypothetical protein